MAHIASVAQQTSFVASSVADPARVRPHIILSISASKKAHEALDPTAHQASSPAAQSRVSLLRVGKTSPWMPPNALAHSSRMQRGHPVGDTNGMWTGPNTPAPPICHPKGSIGGPPPMAEGSSPSHKRLNGPPTISRPYSPTMGGPGGSSLTSSRTKRQPPLSSASFIFHHFSRRPVVLPTTFFSPPLLASTSSRMARQGAAVRGASRRRPVPPPPRHSDATRARPRPPRPGPGSWRRGWAGRPCRCTS